MFSGKTFLYIEDEIEIANLVLDEFREKGAKCIHAVEYKDAVNKANFQKFDIIITDIRLKLGFGDDLVNLIKTNDNHVNYNTPVIVNSAFISDDLRSKIGSFVFEFLPKPHRMSTLIGLVEKAIP